MSQEKHQELFANRDADSDDSSLWDLLRVKKGDYLVAILSGNEYFEIYQIEGLPLSSLALPFDEMPLDGGDKVIRQNDTWGYASISGSLIKIGYCIPDRKIREHLSIKNVQTLRSSRC